MKQLRVGMVAAFVIAAASGVAVAQVHGGSKQQAPARPTRAVTEGPAPAPNADYPLKVHLIDGEAATINGSSVGVGSGNVLGDKPLGFDYTFECDAAVGKNDGTDTFYQGKWKKQDKEIEVLSQGEGNPKVHKCKLKVAMRDFAYDDDQHKPPPLPTVQRQGAGKKKQ